MSFCWVQLRGNQKDVNFQLHHHLSKFEVPVVVNLKHIFELFGIYNTCFLIQKLLELITSSSDGQFWRKSQNKKGGKFEIRSQLCYYNCTFSLLRNVKCIFLVIGWMAISIQVCGHSLSLQSLPATKEKVERGKEQRHFISIVFILGAKDKKF